MSAAAAANEQLVVGLGLADPTGSNISNSRIVNACGRFPCDAPHHPAWRAHTRAFGLSRRAFTIAGNLAVGRRGVVFNGATDREALERVVAVVLGHPPPPPRLRLLVAAAGVGRCLFVHRGCLLESCLAHVPWAVVASRIEEVCNVVVFHVGDWPAMATALGLGAWPAPPRSATATVTRRGTLTLRLTWDDAPWDDDQPFRDAAAALARFVAHLV